MNDWQPAAFFDLTGSGAVDLFVGVDLVWEALDRIKDHIRRIIRPNVAGVRAQGDLVTRTQVLWQGRWLDQTPRIVSGDVAGGRLEVHVDGQLLPGATVVYAGASLLDDEIELGPGVVVEPGALLKGPTIIGPRTEIRQGAYLRGSGLVGSGCVVGHATELKNSVLLDGAKAGHFAYLGDSILGRGVNLGAGTKLANLKMVPRPIRIRWEGGVWELARRKCGAILGDGVETGCNSVTSPGTLMGPGCLVAPNSTVPSGYHPPGTLIR